MFLVLKRRGLALFHRSRGIATSITERFLLTSVSLPSANGANRTCFSDASAFATCPQHQERSRPGNKRGERNAKPSKHPGKKKMLKRCNMS